MRPLFVPVLCAAFLWVIPTFAQVQEAWVARYSGGAGSSSLANALAVDSAGNAYVTGASYDPLSNNDYVTVKYDAAGKQRWVARYNGPGNDDDDARGVALDSAGNVYVTGSSRGTGTGYDFATIKYDANGNQLWAARYNGPAGGDDTVQHPTLALDGAGNVYVAGGSIGAGNVTECATVKYAPDGTQLWVARSPDAGEPFGIAVDSATNTYVTGSSATIKIDANGNQRWAAGPGGGVALALDSAGNVHVASVGVAGGSVAFKTAKYDANGNELWAVYYNGPGNGEDRPVAIAVDRAGYVYVTGETYWNFITRSDYATVKYDANGNQLWVARYDGARVSSPNDLPAAMALDGAGNVYVTGASGRNDYGTVKYDANGAQLWAITYNGPSGDNPDQAVALALDAAGNVYVTGASTNPDGSGYDYATVKYVQSQPVAPQLKSPALSANGQFQFTLIGEAGRSYEIQFSSDLQSWTTLTNLVSATGTDSITDSVSGSRRFYRAVTP